MEDIQKPYQTALGILARPYLAGSVADSSSMANECVAIDKKVTLTGLDALAGAVKLRTRLTQGPEYMTWALKFGRVLRARRAWRDMRLVGKHFYLDDAYRQLAVSPADADAAVIAGDDPERPGAVRFFIAHALPFGAKASVMQFSRAAAGFRARLVRRSAVLEDNYMGDFPVVVPAATQRIIEENFGTAPSCLG